MNRREMVRAGLAIGTGLLSGSVAASQDAAAKARPPALAEVDRVRIAEAFRLADALGNRIWPDWDQAPFAVLLVTADHEFLIRHDKPTKEFKPLGQDDLLKSKVWYRPRQFPKNRLATFPAVSGVPTIVIGQAENTESKTSTRWVITLLHEHFHQLQNSRPRYYADVDSLGLARGDTSGMWMLNYPFPYATKDVKEEFAAMARALGATLQARELSTFDTKLTAYREHRKKFRALLKADEYKYFAFQLWQEGVARYTEIRLADLAAAKYEPTQGFRELKDYQSFTETATDIRERMEKELATVALDKAKRTVVYNFGAAEALVLDRARPDWRKHYFDEKFTLDPHFRTGK
jgi:hypothetical protein